MNVQQQVIRAAAWWQANRQEVSGHLPLLIRQAGESGVTLYPENFDISHWLQEYQSGNLTDQDAEHYILNPLRPLFQYLQAHRYRGGGGTASQSPISPPGLPDSPSASQELAGPATGAGLNTGTPAFRLTRFRAAVGG